MGKMGFSFFGEGMGVTTDIVAPQSEYPTKEDFLDAAMGECEGFYFDEKLALENIVQDYCRWYPVAPEGLDFPSGCYSFCSPGRGAFPVWRIAL